MGCGPSAAVDDGGGGADGGQRAIDGGGGVDGAVEAGVDGGARRLDASPSADGGPPSDAWLYVEVAPGPTGGVATSLTADRSYTADNRAWTPLTLAAVYLEAGEARALGAGFYVRGPSAVTYNVTAFGLIACEGPNTSPPGVWTTGNWIGADVEVGVQQYIHATVTAPTSGLYTCRLDVRSQGQYGNTPTMVLEGGPARTFLHISGPLPRAAAWHLEGDDEIMVGEGRYVLRQSFERPASGDTLEVRADLELTTCNYATGNCSEAAWGPRGASGSTVRTRLMVAQLDRAGAPCAGWITDPPTGLRTTFVPRDRVHWKLHHRVLARVDRSSSCTDAWAAKLWVEDVSGNPIRTEGWAAPRPYSQGSLLWDTGAAVDLDEDGCADLIGRSASTGALEWLGGDCAGGFTPARPLGTGWGGLDDILAPGDLTGDGCTDVVARDGAVLQLYRGSCGGGLSSAGPIASVAAESYERLVALGDYDRDGCVDVGGIRAAGEAFLHRGDCAGGLGAATYLGSVGANDWVLGGGDWSGDGCSDLLVRTPGGALRGHFGDCRRHFSAQDVPLGTGWGGMDWILGGRDVDGDGCDDVVARRVAEGTLLLYRGDCAGGWVSGTGEPLGASVAGYDHLL